VPGSPIYKDGSEALIGDYYTEGELNDDGVPYGFFSEAQTDVETETGITLDFGTRPAAALNRYPVFFDRRISHARANELGVYLSAGGYVDSLTRVLEVTLVTYNRKLELFGITDVSATLNEASNSWELAYEVDMIDVVVYSDSKSDTLRKVLEAFYVICLGGLIVRELFELKDFIHKFGKVAGIIVYATGPDIASEI
jgi:hypothetical protein